MRDTVARQGDRRRRTNPDALRVRRCQYGNAHTCRMSGCPLLRYAGDLRSRHRALTFGQPIPEAAAEHAVRLPTAAAAATSGMTSLAPQNCLARRALQAAREVIIPLRQVVLDSRAGSSGHKITEGGMPPGLRCRRLQPGSRQPRVPARTPPGSPDVRRQQLNPETPGIVGTA